MSSAMLQEMGERARWVEKRVDSLLGQYPVVLQAERRLGVAKLRLAEASVAALALLVLAMLAPALVATALVVGVPMWQTVGVLSSKSKSSATSLVNALLAYWFVMGAVMLGEALPGWSALRQHSSLYGLVRLAFLLWLQFGHHPLSASSSPSSMMAGAQMVHERALQPVFAMLAALGSPSSQPAKPHHKPAAPTPSQDEGDDEDDDSNNGKTTKSRLRKDL